MKKILPILLLFASIAEAQIVSIPDANFKAVLLSASPGNMIAYSTVAPFDTCAIDTNGDGEIQEAEAAVISSLNVNSSEITNLTGISAFTNLVSLYCPNNSLTSVDMSTLTTLKNFDCSWNFLTALDITALVNLETLICGNNSLTSLDVGPLANLSFLDCNKNELTAITNLPLATNLVNLYCDRNQITALPVATLTNLETLNFRFNQVTSLDVSSNTQLTTLSGGYNPITAFNVSMLPDLILLDCEATEITTLNVASNTQLKELYCGSNPFNTGLTVSMLSDLEKLSCPELGLDVLDVSNNPLLKELQCFSNNLLDLNLTNNDNLTLLSCGQNQLTSLDLSNLGQLTYLDYSASNLPAVDFSNLVNLKSLYISSTGRSSLDITPLTELERFSCGSNPLTTVDVSSLTKLLDFDAGGPGLVSIFMKNGMNEEFGLIESPDLEVICADESQLENVSSVLTAFGGDPDAIITTYCTFVPGGDYNTISGHSRYDVGEVGCDENDLTTTNLKYSITDGTATESSIVNGYAEYGFSVGIGNYTIAPQFENPEYFTATPASATFDFPLLDSSIQTQDFCLAAAGIFNDLEVVLTPLGPARPGEDAKYLLLYKNKGTEEITGSVTFTFDDGKTDFVSADPVVDTQDSGSLTWNFINFRPFDYRTAIITFNVNSPIEDPAVNDGDILEYSAVITSVPTEQTPSDNVFELQQVVVNSLDPNAKKCLEGDIVSPEKIGDYLHYNIEFENLGTAPALNVVVKDVIDTTKFDINSLQVLYTSHYMFTSIKDNVVEFQFPLIYLAAAAGDPPVGGHGNILFKIKTLPSLAIGTEVENTANIFFDYNIPIDTNKARTIFATLNVPEKEVDHSVVIYPNPAKHLVTITGKSIIRSIDLYDIQGRLLQTAVEDKSSAKLDVSGRADGIYFVKITTDSGAMVQKLVVE